MYGGDIDYGYCGYMGRGGVVFSLKDREGIMVMEIDVVGDV